MDVGEAHPDDGQATLQVNALGRLHWAKPAGAGREDCAGCHEAHEEISTWLESLYSRQTESLCSHPPPHGSKIFFSLDPTSRKPAWKVLLDPNRPEPVLRTQIPLVARTDWTPIEAALFVHSEGQFHPRREWRGVETVPEVYTVDGSVDTSQLLVSVLCPTTSERQAYHPLVYECFRTQTHQRRELVVVDTGSEPSKFFLEKAAEDPRIVYRFYASPPKAWPLGLKRNIGCYISRGQVIAHFDDDDFYAQAYLSFLLERLVTKKGRSLWKSCVPAVVAKLSAWHILDADTMTWGFLDAKTDPEVEEMRKSWLYGWGFSYMYTRTVWEQEPFPEVTFAEDYLWMSKLLDAKVPVNLARDQRMQTEGIACHTYHPSTSTSGGEFCNDRRCGFLVARPPPGLAALLPTLEEALAVLPRKQPSNKYEAILRQDFADRIGLREKAHRGGHLLKYRLEHYSSHMRW